MKDRLNSIRFRSWLTFVLFSLIVIVFLYFFQVVLLSSYYEYMKIQETASAAKQIKDAWSQQPENLNSIVSDIADKQKIYIEISDSNRPYFRASSLDKSNKEVYSLITSLSPNDMKEIISGENTFFTATIPRTNNDSKAIVLIAQLDDGTESTFFKTNGIVRLYIFNYLEPLGTTTAILHSQLNLTAGIIIIVAFIMSIIFSNSISKPIINISKAALKLPQGQFDMPVKKNSFTEINELTDTLSSASVEIAKADTLRKDLMANISHDLRTPLTMIKAYAEMIRDLSGDNPEKREKHLQVIIDETDRLTQREQLEDYFYQALEVELLLRLCPDDEDAIYQIVDLLVDTCSTKRKMLRIAGDDKPVEVVRSRLKKLNADHIRFVLGCLAENTSPVRNMKQYLLAALFNAPTTMNLYYQNKTNHDFARGSPGR